MQRRVSVFKAKSETNGVTAIDRAVFGDFGKGAVAGFPGLALEVAAFANHFSEFSNSAGVHRRGVSKDSLRHVGELSNDFACGDFFAVFRDRLHCGFFPDDGLLDAFARHTGLGDLRSGVRVLCEDWTIIRDLVSAGRGAAVVPLEAVSPFDPLKLKHVRVPMRTRLTVRSVAVALR